MTDSSCNVLAKLSRFNRCRPGGAYVHNNMPSPPFFVEYLVNWAKSLVEFLLWDFPGLQQRRWCGYEAASS